MAILKCENVSFAYDGENVLEGVDFELNAGDYLCVVGENGSGKSTLIKGLLGLKAPRGGKITMFPQPALPRYGNIPYCSSRALSAHCPCLR